MNKKIITISTFFLMIIFTLCPETKAYDDKTTHIDITEAAVSSKKCGLDEYLKNNLGFSNGYETILKEKEIMKWLQEGSENEDSPDCRASNHFHDPLVGDWLSSGLSHKGFITTTLCPDWPYEKRKSAVTWAAA